MPGVYEIFIQDHFSAAHVLRGYDGSCAKTHGHNWMVDVNIQCRKLSKLGFGIDFLDVKRVLKDILGKLDHTTLNDVVEFSSINPTAENIAKFLYSELSRRLNTEFITVKKVMVLESPGCGAAYQEI